MTNLFAYFTSAQAPFRLPGAPYWMAAVLIFFSLALTIRLMRKRDKANSTRL
jgi:hypothetical protein